MSPKASLPRVLIVAGSDSGGGAGIQADLKTVMAMGGYGLTAITALTAQSTEGVFGIHAVPIAFVRQQIALGLDDPGADVVKTGMLGSAALIEAVAESLPAPDRLPRVVDPVMVAKGGHPLLPDSAVEALKRHLLPGATLVTPNLPEAAVLAGFPVESEADMARAADAILALGASAVLVKGGHLAGPEVVDLLVADDGTRQVWRDARLETRHTHGTGCTLASAVAVGLAAGRPLSDAIASARAYVRRAIARAPGIGRGHGPLGHGAAMEV